jgi:glucosamine--fructose-6-phosphate aminotransferase (isomerizing)
VLFACRELKGTFGVCVIDRDEPNQLIAARRGSPLVIGVGDGFRMVCSDTNAIIPYTNQILYLEDHEVATVTRDSVTIEDLEEHEIARESIELDTELEAIELGDFPHYMLKEIFEQPNALRNVLAGRFDAQAGECHLGGITLTPKELSRIERVIIVGCGTSWHAGLLGEYYIESLAKVNCEVEYASELRYRNPILNPDTDMAIVISQSGETADTLAALREIKRKGVFCFGICNVVGSTIAREVDGGIYTHAGPEIGVASTKAFTTQTAALLLFAIHLGRNRQLDGFVISRMGEELMGLPSRVEDCLKKHEEIRSVAQKYVNNRNFLYLGRGYGFPVALEGALKLKEISYIHAEGYPAAEMKHGPIALIDQDMPVVVLAPQDRVYEKVLSNVEEVVARGGRVLAIVSDGDGEIHRLAETVITIPRVSEQLIPFLAVVPLQLLAYYIAVARGCNVDKPRNLAKSVTVE